MDYQVNELGKNSAELQRLDAAHTTFKTYQSNNALFNALISTTGKKDGDPVVQEIRRVQTSNYEYGLQAIEDALPKGSMKDVPLRTSPFAPSTDLLDNIQARLEKLQALLDERQEAIRRSVDHANKWYVAWYIILSTHGNCWSPPQGLR